MYALDPSRLPTIFAETWWASRSQRGAACLGTGARGCATQRGGFL